MTEREAGETISAYRRRSKFSHRGKKIPCRKYWCRECRSFHVTHYKKGIENYEFK